MGIDLRTIECECANPNCKKGIRFDTNPATLIFQDEHMKDHFMRLSRNNIDVLIHELKAHRKLIKK